MGGCEDETSGGGASGFKAAFSVCLSVGADDEQGKVLAKVW